MRMLLFVPVMAWLLANLDAPPCHPIPLEWSSKYVSLQKDGRLLYYPDERGNIIPDFSNVGYRTGNEPIPKLPVVTTITPGENAESAIQEAIDALAKKPLNAQGFRGAILLKQGTYQIKNRIRIAASGIILRGEGLTTKLIATGTDKAALIQVQGEGSPREISGTRTALNPTFVPVGAKTITVDKAHSFKVGDPIILECATTPLWIARLKMNQIVARSGTRQWTENDYIFKFQRLIQGISGNQLFLDNPTVMEMDPQYNTAVVYKYQFEGRISNVGIEDLYCETTFDADTAENHSWNAIYFNKIEHGWIKNVEARYFSFGCVNLGGLAKNISVLNCAMRDHKSVITGSRRYSFNNDGQLNLFMHCIAEDGRHDYVTGAKVCGPNVFFNSSATKTHADIGPHHRWAMGTLYDQIKTDGDINIQDRGNWGSGHGWAGVTQILWNCTAKRATVQNPWISGKNYSIGLQGEKTQGRLEGRPDGVWEGQNQKGLQPSSLYLAQLHARSMLK